VRPAAITSRSIRHRDPHDPTLAPQDSLKHSYNGIIGRSPQGAGWFPVTAEARRGHLTETAIGAARSRPKRAGLAPGPSGRRT
jgi:hypothetical protein